MKVFIEEQRFTQTWLIVLMAVTFIIPLALILNEYIKVDSTMSLTEFLLVLGACIASFGLIFIFKLKTRIDEKGIHYQFLPIHFSMRKIVWNDIDKAFVREYDAFSEYGGWGLKGGSLWNKEKGTAINIKGNIGIQLELKNGKKLLIGTQKEQEVERVLRTYESKINKNKYEN